MRKLDAFPESPTETRYPWDQWLTGEIVQLFQGQDYDAKTKTIVANARVQAKRRDGTVKTRLLSDDGRESVVLQFRRGSR